MWEEALEAYRETRWRFKDEHLQDAAQAKAGIKLNPSPYNIPKPYIYIYTGTWEQESSIDMYKHDVGTLRVPFYGTRRVPFFFINFLPTSLSYICILRRQHISNTFETPAGCLCRLRYCAYAYYAGGGTFAFAAVLRRH